MNFDMEVKSSGGLFAILLSFAICLPIIGGWIANIVKLVGMSFSDPNTVELVLRVVGYFMAPLGVVMGYL